MSHLLSHMVFHDLSHLVMIVTILLSSGAQMEFKRPHERPKGAKMTPRGGLEQDYGVVLTLLCENDKTQKPLTPAKIAILHRRCIKIKEVAQLSSELLRKCF